MALNDYALKDTPRMDSSDGGLSAREGRGPPGGDTVSAPRPVAPEA